MKRLVVESSQCSGCRICELVCSYGHEGKFSSSLSRVTVIKDEKHGMDYPNACRQCEDCPAIIACPTEALSKTLEGTIELDSGACIGCGICASTCTYDAIGLSGASTPLICDLCGGTPTCAEKCPTGALAYSENEFRSEKSEDVFRVLRGRWGIDG